MLYHYRTGEWTQDSEGFWRDSDGYYVVAAGDMAQGSTFTGSKGDCKVYDSGCAAGTTDYYTVGNFSASRIFGGRASLPSFRAT